MGTSSHPSRDGPVLIETARLDLAMAERPDLVASFHRDTAPLLVRRLTFLLFLFLSFLAIVTAAAWVRTPHLGLGLLPVVAVYGAGCVTVLLLCRVPRLHRLVPAVSIILGATMAAEISYTATVLGAPLEQLALAQICLLTGSAVMLPWTVVGQLVVTLVAVASVLVPALWSGLEHLPTVLGLVVGATISVLGTRFVNGYRRSTYVQTALVREEAEIASALANVAQVLAVDLNRPDMLERVTRLAAEILGCDWTATFTWSDRPSGFRLAASFGLVPDVGTELAAVEFLPEGSKLRKQFRPGELVEMASGERQHLLPQHLIRRFEMASALFAPLYTGRSLIGVLAFVHRTRSGSFGPREHRLALGIAHTVAVALQNARLIADLTSANRLKSDFVATMSHELRTPLNIILGYTDLLAAGDFGDLNARQQDVLECTQRNALQLFELVNATLDLNRMDAGRETVDPSIVSLEALFRELDGEVAPLARDGVRLKWVNEVAARAIVTDRAKLKTILKNLVGNALKFTERGCIEVVACGRQAHLTLEVRDTGIGIPSEKLPLIFEMFRQLDASSTRRHDGVGLGLHIVKRLVDLLGGSIVVASEVGVGTTFTVTVPLVAAGEERLAG